MEAIQIEPDKLTPFGEDDVDTFFLVTNQSWVEKFSLHSTIKYKNHNIISYNDSRDFKSRLAKNIIPQHCHLLVILPNCLFQSIPEEIIGNRKILFMACKSGEIGAEGIKHFLKCGYATDPGELQAISDNIFNKGEASDRFIIKDKADASIEADFNHMEDYYDWHEQLGFVDWGGQQIFPAGEIACFSVPLKEESLSSRLFNLSGNIIFTGPVIVQSGPPSFRPRDQMHIYEKLNSVSSGLNLHISKGVITQIEPMSVDDAEAADMLSSLIKVDSRYSNIYEVGLSLNNKIRLFPGNTAMNEVWGEDGGNIHLGLGMLPFTQYHVDMFCKNAYIINEKSDLIFGKKRMDVKKSSICPCIPL
jgi:hypothetical protein